MITETHSGYLSRLNFLKNLIPFRDAFNLFWLMVEYLNSSELSKLCP